MNESVRPSTTTQAGFCRHWVRRLKKICQSGISLTAGFNLGIAIAIPASAQLAAQRQIPYPTLHRPFAMPMVKEQDFSGALFVGDGESRFTVRIDLLTKANKVIRENITPNIYWLGPLAPDGSYKGIQISTDDRTITPAQLAALQEVISHPSEWPADEVTQATSQLPTLKTSYAQMQTDRRTIVIQYARTGTGNTLVASITALDDDTTVFLEAASPYNEPGTFQISGQGVVGSAPGILEPSKTSYLVLAPSQKADDSAAYASVADMITAMTGGNGALGSVAAALTYHLHKGQTITFSAGVDSHPVSVSAPNSIQILSLLAKAEANVDRNYLTGSGITGRSAIAVRDALSLNTNYDEKYYQNFVMWGLGGGGDDIFTGWDSAWDAISAAMVNPQLAMQHENDLFDAGGPRYDQENAGPMHAYAVWRLYTDFNDLALLQKAYPVLVAFYDKLPEWDANHDGLLESPYFGDRISGHGNHLGLDDSPVYANYQPIPKEGGSGDPRPNTNLTDVALNSYYALFAETLAKMAKVLDHPDDAARFTANYNLIKTKLNEQLWNQDRGLYLSRYLDGTWDEVNTPTVFYPLFAGIATPERAQVLVKQHLLNPDEFWGDYAIPSVARNDPTYCSNGSVHPESKHFKFFQSIDDKSAPEEWKGAVWPPMNATVYDGLKRYGFDVEAGELATKSTAIYLDTWDRDRWFAESFDPEPGQSIMDSAVDTAARTYSWSNVMPLQSLHELISDDPWGDPDGIIFGSLSLPGVNSISHLQLHGHEYAVSASPLLTTLSQDGKTIFSSLGARVVVRNFVRGQRNASFDVTADNRAFLAVALDEGGWSTKEIPPGTSHCVLGSR